MGSDVNLTIGIVDPEADPDEVDRATRSLRRELAELETVTVASAADTAEPGAKGDLTLLGTVMVSMLSAAVPAVVAIVGRWVQDRGRCVVRIAKPDGTSLVISHSLSREEIERIVLDPFLAR